MNTGEPSFVLFQAGCTMLSIARAKALNAPCKPNKKNMTTGRGEYPNVRLTMP